MTARTLYTGLVAATLAFGFGGLNVAEARRVVVDNAEFLNNNAVDPGCVIADGNCTAFTLPFTVTFGLVSTNQIYGYENGVISFGSQISAATPASATFDQYGVPVIAPLAFTSGSSFAPFSIGFATVSSVAFNTFLSTGQGDYAILAFDNDSSSEDLDDAVYLLMRQAANGQDLLFEMIHGSCFCVFNNGENGPNLTGGALGYNLGNQSLFVANLTDDDVEKTLVFTYSPAVPEPRSWAMMLFGFGIVGMAARRRSESSRRGLATRI